VNLSEIFVGALRNRDGGAVGAVGVPNVELRVEGGHHLVVEADAAGETRRTEGLRRACLRA